MKLWNTFLRKKERTNESWRPLLNDCLMLLSCHNKFARAFLFTMLDDSIKAPLSPIFHQLSRLISLSRLLANIQGKYVLNQSWLILLNLDLTFVSWERWGEIEKLGDRKKSTITVIHFKPQSTNNFFVGAWKLAVQDTDNQALFSLCNNEWTNERIRYVEPEFVNKRIFRES